MQICAWEGCEEEVALSVYEGGATYQPKYCKPHRKTAARQYALTRSPGIGQKKTDSRGYIHVRTDRGWIPEHRLVMEKQVGRELTLNEHVYHKNGVRDDNRPENLEVRHKFGVDVDDLVCPHCGEPYRSLSERSDRDSAASVGSS